METLENLSETELGEKIAEFTEIEMNSNCGPESFIAGANRVVYEAKYKQLTGREYEN